MHIGRIIGATRDLGAPKGWDPATQGRCLSLPVRDEIDAAGHRMSSAWLPTPEELAAIAAGAPIHLTIFAGAHPPVMLSVGDPPEAVSGYVAPDTDAA
jgi:hypothetical protein